MIYTLAYYLLLIACMYLYKIECLYILFSILFSMRTQCIPTVLDSKLTLLKVWLYIPWQLLYKSSFGIYQP